MGLWSLIPLIVGIALGALGALAWRRPPRPSPDDAASAGSKAAAVPTAEPPPPLVDDVFTIAISLENTARKIPHPRDLLENARFQRAVELMSGLNRSPEALLDYMGSGKVALGCIALETLARRTDEADVTPMIERIPVDYVRVEARTAYFALRALAKRSTQAVVARVLARVNRNWIAPLRLGILREFVSQRLQEGEAPSFEQELVSVDPHQIEQVASVLDALGNLVPESLHAEIRGWREMDGHSPSETESVATAMSPGKIDTDTLERVGRVWKTAGPALTSPTITERLDALVAQVALSLRAERPRSVALVGEIGVGKTALIRALAQQLAGEEWTIFEAGSVDLMAGQMFIGQIEERVKTIVATLRGHRALWVIPDFQDLAWAGTHKDNPTGVLDRLLPYVESGEIRIVAEMTPAGYERLLQLKPRVRRALVAVRMIPPTDAELLTVTRQWAAKADPDSDGSLIAEPVLREALQLAKQYITDRSAPGNVLDLLKQTHQRLVTSGRVPARIAYDDLIATLSQLTGLPVAMLDDRATLDLEGLRALFRKRVIGQPDAVECLVERVAMMKAGVTDPTRAAGVFLFVGPTGTGKTEIAKTLAQHLFGSPDRMIRLDMSELQNSDATDRIVGDAGERSESTALVHSIRRQPFAVILLDEFEKAHPNVWDLFLQVFDDGRLTDRRGNVADFRHAVIILTSNLGATLPYGAVIGFAPGQEEFAANSVERAVADAFRREFINRIDRVVVFRPLGRAEMREILHKELDDVFKRRGLRNRSWAVEWEASAIDFLLEKGFTPDLGARPLKRAVERYLLAPLATTIVNHSVPGGDQFLFVRSDGDRLDVVFVDPNAPDDPADAVPSVSHEGVEDLDLRRIVLEARGSREEVHFLDDRYAELTRQVESEDWQERKATALASMRANGFWESPDRFTVLGNAEYMDRIEAGLQTAGSLLRRLGHQSPGARRSHPRDVVQRLAQQLYLIEAACATLATGYPRDAYLLVRASRDSGTDHVRADAFAGRIADAYREWAKKRRMRFDVIEETPGAGATPYMLLAAVSGFGAFSILEPESGLHVLETPQDAKSFNRVKARVAVAPQDESPIATPRELRSRALRAVEARAEETSQVIVRRYRDEPSPLVRDAVRQWRTGRVDRVYAGDFDVIG